MLNFKKNPKLKSVKYPAKRRENCKKKNKKQELFSIILLILQTVLFKTILLMP